MAVYSNVQKKHASAVACLLGERSWAAAGDFIDGDRRRSLSRRARIPGRWKPGQRCASKLLGCSRCPPQENGPIGPPAMVVIGVAPWPISWGRHHLASCEIPCSAYPNSFEDWAQDHSGVCRLCSVLFSWFETWLVFLGSTLVTTPSPVTFRSLRALCEWQRCAELLTYLRIYIYIYGRCLPICSDLKLLL